MICQTIFSSLQCHLLQICCPFMQIGYSVICLPLPVSCYPLCASFCCVSFVGLSFCAHIFFVNRSERGGKLCCLQFFVLRTKQKKGYCKHTYSNMFTIPERWRKPNPPESTNNYMKLKLWPFTVEHSWHNLCMAARLFVSSPVTCLILYCIS